MPIQRACYNNNGKEVGSLDILTQLNLAMDYIEAHIDDDLALADVSSVTAYSPYHFGRLFYYIADMPLSEYMGYIQKRQKRLYWVGNSDSFQSCIQRVAAVLWLRQSCGS